MVPPRWRYIASLRLRSLFRSTRVERELDEELRFHVEERAREFEARGLSPRDARDAALRAFGGLEQRKEECRDARRLGLIEDFAQDVRYALRMMRRAPGFTAIAIVSLALGIGANTAIFSAIDAVMLRGLPVPHNDELHLLHWTAADFPQPFARSLDGGGGRSVGGTTSGGDMFPYATFTHLRARDLAVVAFSADPGQANVGVGGSAESVQMLGVSGNYFPGIGISPVLGRSLDEDDDRAGAAPVAVISNSFWRAKLGAAADAIGRVLMVNGQPMTIVGVLPAAFYGLEPGVAPDLWIPLTRYAQHPSRAAYLTDSHIWWVRIVTRVTRDQSASMTSSATSAFRASIGAVGAQAALPNAPVLGFTPIARGIDSMRQAFSQSLWLLMVMVGLVLLVTCANLAGLLLERANARRREMAVRLSLGVRRARLVRQLLTESIMLAIFGGAAALVATVWTYPLVMSLLVSGRIPDNLQRAIDARTLAFTAILSMVVGVAFGLAPALRSTRVTLIGALTQRSVVGRERRGITAGKVLVAAQIAVCLVLLVGAGLFVRTVQQLHATDVGFDRDNLLLLTVEPGLNGYQGARLATYYEELRERIASVPGVSAVTIARRPPLGAGFGRSMARLLDVPNEQTADLSRHEVAAGYFETLGIRIVAGRAIDDRDTAAAPHVLVINETTARQFFKDRDPIGARLDFGSPAVPLVFQIVGVAKDVKYGRIRSDIPPTIYLPYQQAFGTPNAMTYLVRTEIATAALIPAMQRQAQIVDATVPLTNVRTQLDAIDRTLAAERTFAAFSTVLGALALLLACVGLYGTMAYAVTRRTNEIGVRVALGASRANVLRMLLAESLLIVAAGALVGIPAALAAARTISARLYGVTPLDVPTIAAATAMLLVVAATAAFIPARRAAALDPTTALRAD